MKKRLAYSPGRLVAILTFGVFGIINTEMGVVGIIPQIAETFGVTVPQAGWTVGVFALVVAVSAPVMPLLFSGTDRRTVMLLALGLFTAGNIVSALTDSFAVLLAARALPAFLHPAYVSMAFSTAAAMTFFAAVNAATLAATLLCVPRLPVARRISYGAQLGVLKKAVMRRSLIAFTLINGAMFGFFSYMSDFLNRVTEVSSDTASALLLVYGGANIAGNLLAGRLLARNARRCMIVLPVLLSAAYLLLFAAGAYAVAAAAIILALGILAGMAGNTGQYMISDAAPEAPDFANGLFLTSANLGTTVGTALCGLFIAGFGTRSSLLGALLFSAAGIGSVIARNRTGKLKAATP